MIEDWLIKFALFCFIWMCVCAAILNDLLRIGKDHVEESEENGEEE